MNIVAAVFADFETTFLGDASHLGTRLAGRPMIEHTLRRLVRIHGVTHHCLVVPPPQADLARAAVAALPDAPAIDVLPIDNVPRPRRELLAAGRVWNLHAWRGGVYGATWFDEFVEPPLVGLVINHYSCDGVFCLAGHQPAFDPDLATAMVAYQGEREAETDYVFSMALPGLTGIVLCRSFVAELLDQNLPLGMLLAYRPESPRSDPINRPPCYQLDAVLCQTRGRAVADTHRSRELLEAALDELGPDASALDLAKWFATAGHDPAGPLPLETEIELTTDDPLPDTILRPRGSRVPSRRPASLDAIQHLSEQFAPLDDRLIILGGHGDPLQHPDFAAISRRIRTAARGLAVVTPLVDLTDANLEALFDAPADILQVRLDANSPARYAELHGRDVYEQVIANIRRVSETRRARGLPRPIVACSLTRHTRTLAELEEFYDRWIAETGWAVIEGYSPFGGLLPPDTLLTTTPPHREACRRLTSRLTLLADGTAAACDQDVTGALGVGTWPDTPLAEIWQSPAMNALRAAHAGVAAGQDRGDLASYPTCAVCDQWFRP